MTNVAALVQQSVARLEEAIHAEARARVLEVLGASTARGGMAARRASSASVASRRRLQGQYIGLLRSLTGRARQRVQSTARKDGVRSALSLARQLERS